MDNNLSARTKATLKYKKNNIKKYCLEVNMKTETDILNKIESVPSKATYIKNLIREDIKKEKK